MKRFAVLFSAIVFLVLAGYCLISRIPSVFASGQPGTNRIEPMPIMKYGSVLYRLPNPDWYPAPKGDYSKYGHRPDVMLYHRKANPFVVRVNLERDRLGFRPATLLHLAFTLRCPKGVEWEWVVRNRGEGPARVGFVGEKRGIRGLADARHLPGRWSSVLIVGGSWPKGKHRELLPQFDLLVESFRVAGSKSGE